MYSGDYSFAELIGRSSHDPELRRTQSGIAVTSYTLALERDSKSQSDKRETDFIDIVAEHSKIREQVLFEERMAVVKGYLQIRSWIDTEGNRRRSARLWPIAFTLVIPRGRAEQCSGGEVTQRKRV